MIPPSRFGLSGRTAYHFACQDRNTIHPQSTLAHFLPKLFFGIHGKVGVSLHTARTAIGPFHCIPDFGEHVPPIRDEQGR